MNPNDAMYQVNIQNSWQIISYTVIPLILIHIIENLLQISCGKVLTPQDFQIFKVHSFFIGTI